MWKQLVFKNEHGHTIVPENEELYLKNLDYFKGMGIYDDTLCHEKALLTTGYNIVREPHHGS